MSTDRLDRIEARLARLEKRTSPKSGSLLKLMTASVGDALREVRSQLEAQIPRFCGVHESGRTYPQNSLVIRDGSLWISLAKTTEPPGTPSWQLCVKRGSPREPALR